MGRAAGAASAATGVARSRRSACGCTSTWPRAARRRCTPRFFALYGEAAGGRTVRARLAHPGPARRAGAGRRWPLRVTDFDVMGHMNNAAYWAAVEEELRRRRDLRAPLRAEVEFRVAIEPGDDVRIVDRRTARATCGSGWSAGRRRRRARRPTCGGSS